MTDTETPEVLARVEENWAALEVDGETQTIRADTEEEVRHEVLRRTMQIAADTNADVNLIATDRDGEWRLVVTPQGEISETANPTRPHGAHQGAENGAGVVARPPHVTDAAASDTEPDEAAMLVEPDRDDEVPRWSDEASDTENALTGGGVDDAIPEETTVRTVGARPVEPLPDERTAPTNPTVITDPPPFSAVAPAAPSSPVDSRPDEEVSIWDTVKRVVPSPSGPAAPTATAPPDSDGPAAPPASGVATVPDPSPVATPEPAVASGTVDPVDSAAPTGVAGRSPAEPPAPSPAALPTLADFQATQPPPVAGPATLGWRGVVRRGTGGLISPAPSVSEQRHREAVASVTRSLSGPRTICVINPKGGAHKTTATMLIAATFGLYRGGYTLAWDNNETRGTLGWRAHQSAHSNTAVDLLTDIDRFTDLRSARVGDLDNYVRSQAEAQFDVLASDEDAAASSMIDDDAFRRLHETLQRFYRIIVVDTGNNMRASNWEAAIAAADQLVIVSAIREDTAGGAAWMVEGLARKGHDAKLRDAVTILSAPDKNVDAQLRTRLTDHFGSLTRDVVEVPYDPALVSGAGISVGALAPATREAWLTATATIANGL